MILIAPEVTYQPLGSGSAKDTARLLGLPDPIYLMAGEHREVFFHNGFAIKTYKHRANSPEQITRNIQRELVLYNFLIKKNIPVAKIYEIHESGIVIQKKRIESKILLKESWKEFGPSWEKFLEIFKIFEKDPDYVALNEILQKLYDYSGVDFKTKNAGFVWDSKQKEFTKKGGFIQVELIDW